MKISTDLSVKYQNNKERIQKKLVNNIKFLFNKEKRKMQQYSYERYKMLPEVKKSF